MRTLLQLSIVWVRFQDKFLHHSWKLRVSALPYSRTIPVRWHCCRWTVLFNIPWTVQRLPKCDLRPGNWRMSQCLFTCEPQQLAPCRHNCTALHTSHPRQQAPPPARAYHASRAAAQTDRELTTRPWHRVARHVGPPAALLRASSSPYHSSDRASEVTRSVEVQVRSRSFFVQRASPTSCYVKDRRSQSAKYRSLLALAVIQSCITAVLTALSIQSKTIPMKVNEEWSVMT